MVSGSDSRSEPSQLSDRDLVESVLRDLSEAAPAQSQKQDGQI
ncbi:DUF2710 family protein, partial [Mycobacterium tuberculosis]|nr:DUF2710 family protein [Mycobacterium tuberculosis]